MSTLSVVQDALKVEFGLTSEQVAPEAKLADLGVDSLSALELLFALEDRFKLKFDSEQFPVTTVAEIANEVDRLIATQAAEKP